MRRQLTLLVTAATLLGSARVLATPRTYTGITTEVVDTYTHEVNLDNNPGVLNFVTNMSSSVNGTAVFDPGSGHQWVDNSVWDDDFRDQGTFNATDGNGFDPKFSAISLYTGHGNCEDDPLAQPVAKRQTCTASATCNNPAGYNNMSLPGRCVWSPVSATGGYCMYTPTVNGKAIELNDTHDGTDHWHGFWDTGWHLGDDPISTFTNTWGGDGGVNLAIFYNSCTLRPGSWDQQFSAGFWNGLAVVQAVVPTVPEQYAYYNDLQESNMLSYLGVNHWNQPGGYVYQAWETAFSQTSGGSACAYGGGYLGVSGCGAAVSIYRGTSYLDITPATNATWSQLQSDSVKPHGTSLTWATWTCNYNCSASGHPIYR